MRITFSKTLLLATTAFSMISVPAANAYLSPLSFNEMYAHASRGNLTVLNNAILRGMNINAVNGDGDTGICVAIRRGDHIAYESFRNTGAHTRPRCLNNINAKQYKKFMADHRPYELAYRKEGSSIWWWIGGAAAGRNCPGRGRRRWRRRFRSAVGSRSRRPDVSQQQGAGVRRCHQRPFRTGNHAL